MKPIKSDGNPLKHCCPPTVLIKLIVGWAVDETNKIGSESVGYALPCPPTVLIKLIVGWAVDETNKIGSESVGYALPTNSFNKINRRVGSG
ncbi:hypothetical protein BJP36_04945 [Moorena producens JHB]|uniref:Uncharacterized protein n=1 Tax=Moorena producens (strain JHB) TaxID=1454205 RepID=A0A1D9FW32_MOOP1|nr:hypothetical protein [Moorena producens]AOY79360.2 hypothetical protein BJP36_04945 [Moorena producens JHB]